jgi:hypothetical protein
MSARRSCWRSARTASICEAGERRLSAQRREFLTKANGMFDDWPDDAGRAAYLAGTARRL